MELLESHHIIKEKEEREEESICNSVNHQTENIEYNLQKKIKNETKKEIKKGQYFLTPLESLLLNRLMPHGFKFETEENMIKTLETSKNQTKKNKQPLRYLENLHKSNNRPKNYNNDKEMNITQLKRRTNHSPYYMDNLPNNFTPNICKVAEKCKKGLDKIKNFPCSNYFYESNNPEIPCLSKIEKKLNNYEYISFYDFSMDVRKIWSYFFNLGDQENSDLYDKTSKMSDKWEKIYSELEDSNEAYDIANNIKKRTDKIQKEYNEYKEQYTNKSILAPPTKKVNHNNDNNPMTLEEKNNLGNLIRTLNKDQLRGIIKILTDNNNLMNSKYFEFDIDKLSVKKLRELEKYVKNCLSSNNASNNNNKTNQAIINNGVSNQKENTINVNSDKDKEDNNKIINNNKNKSHEQKMDNKEINKDLENKQNNVIEKKIKQNNIKKNNITGSEFSSESDSLSSESSLSN